MIKKAIYPLLVLCLTLAAAFPAAAREEFEPDPRRFEQDILRFERADAGNYPPPGCVIFLGSSSIRGWKTLREDFPGLHVINRGFGGSQISDAIYFAQRIVVPYHPTAIVFYAGDNDIAHGKSPATVYEDFKEFVRTVHGYIGPRAIYFLSIKPSLARWKMWPEMKEANALIQRWAASRSAVYYLDTATPMLGTDGKPRPELLKDDGLHMTPAGYKVWTGVVKPGITR